MADEEGSWYCTGCDDDWTVWLRFETWVWAVLLLIHLSMVAFLVIHGRTDKSFREAFYILFIAVTVVDCALALLRPSRDSYETIFGTIYDLPFVEQEDPQTHTMKYTPTIRSTMNQLTEHVLVPALGHAQQLFLTAIAVNRFTAFALPLKHASMWRTRTVIVTTITLAAMSIILGTACPFVSAIRQVVVCSRATRKQRELIGCDFDLLSTYRTFKQQFIPAALITITSAICCMVSFVLNVSSVAMLIALRTTGRLQRKGPELQLFAHSLWMFLLQLLVAFQEVIHFADIPAIIAYELGLDPLGFTWDKWTHSSEWLAGVNGTRQLYDDVLVFTPGCLSYPDNNYATPMCNAWYLLLTGELSLRLSPHFTVRTLELCLFALSGSVFLLFISGNVRQAYFNFYFKWQCWKKMHNSAQIFKRTARGALTPSVTTTPIMSMSSQS